MRNKKEPQARLFFTLKSFYIHPDRQGFLSLFLFLYREALYIR